MDFLVNLIISRDENGKRGGHVSLLVGMIHCMQTYCNWDSIFLWSRRLLVKMYSEGNILNVIFNSLQHLDNRLVGPNISNYTPCPRETGWRLWTRKTMEGSVALSLCQFWTLETLGCEVFSQVLLSGSFMTNAIVDRCLQRWKPSLFLVSWFLWLLKNHQASFMIAQLKFLSLYQGWSIS